MKVLFMKLAVVVFVISLCALGCSKSNEDFSQSQSDESMQGDYDLDDSEESEDMTVQDLKDIQALYEAMEDEDEAEENDSEVTDQKESADKGIQQQGSSGDILLGKILSIDAENNEVAILDGETGKSRNIAVGPGADRFFVVGQDVEVTLKPNTNKAVSMKPEPTE
ncbi:MAG: hypothetical protein ABII27_05550 [bacterium]